MTKRTYVAPEWHTMGMPIASAACQEGANDIGVMGGCGVGGNASTCFTGKSPAYTGACRNGGIALPTCLSGNVDLTSNDCLSGSNARW